MRFSFKRIGFAAGAVALSLAMAACHGQSPGSSSYIPSNSTALSVPQAGAGLAAPDAKQKVQIVSSCGKHVRIVLLGIVDCKFRETNHGDGTFTLTNDTKGIIVITPMSGNQSTKFTILGALLGSGHFVVKDDKGRHLKVTVKVII